MTRKGCTVAMLTVLAIPAIFAAANSTAAQQPAPLVDLKAGIADPVNTVLAWYMARAAGLYTAQGLKVDIINMNGGSRGAEELQAGRIDIMHVGLSSVIKVNQSGGDLRLIGALSNVIRFTFFSAPGVKTAADLKGGIIGISTFGSESDLDRDACLAETRPDAQRRHHQGIWRRHAPPRSSEVGRDQGDADQRADRVAGARGQSQCAGRSRAGPDPLAVFRHRRAARRHGSAP